jgi:hypothetical protein
LAGNRIKSIAVDGQTILVGTINGTGIGDAVFPGDPSRDYATLGGGLYRSTDGGTTFTLDTGTVANPLPAGAVPSVVVDPNNAMRVFAAVAGQGVFRSEDGGASWNAFGTGLTGAAGSSDIELAAQSIGGNTTLFAGVSRTGSITGATNASPIVITANNHGLQTGDTVVISGVGGNKAANNAFTITFVNANQFSLNGSTGNGAYTGGGTWQWVRAYSATNFTGSGNWTALAASPLGLNPGNGFAEKFQLTADPTNANVVYIDGEGGTGIYRYNPAGAGSWVQIDDGGAQGTGPHADSRDLKFLANNTLLESDDGGIFFLQNPTTATTSNWNSFNGNLGSFEFYSLAYDPTNHVIIGGAQDNAVPYQSAPNSTSWTQFLGGDGQTEAVDATSLGGNVLRYSLNNNLGGFQHNRFNNANAQVTASGNSLAAQAAGGLVTGATNAAPIVITSNNHGLLAGDQVFIGGVQGNTAANFTNSVAITVVDANHFSLNGSSGVGSGAYLAGGSWQRTTPITNASGTAGNPVVITSTNNHRLNTGDEVFIQGLTGTYAPLNNSSYYITVTDMTHFTLNGTTSDGSTAAGGFYSISNNVMLKSAIGAANLSGLNAADAGFNGFLPIPYVLNSVDPRMMLLGFTGLYEDADTNAANGFAGDVINNISANVPGLAGNVTALAYGGQRGGSGFTNVAVVGNNAGQLWFRGETGAAFTNVSSGNPGDIGGDGAPIYSIALDPKDWRRVYVVKNNQVWFTANITNLGANPFQVIGGGAGDNLASLTTQLRSVNVVAGTPVVGGQGGVYRMLTQATGLPGNALWSKYGQGMPNAVTRDIRYDAANDLLIGSAFGRGVWTIPNASTTIGVVGILQINGDTDFAGEDDTIKLVIDSSNLLLLDVFLNSATPTVQIPLAAIQQINVNGLGGNDTLIVDSTNGLINVPLGINYDGGTGFNTLQLVQTGGATQGSDVYSPGPNPGEGTDVITGPGGTQTVFFQNLAPVLDTVPATTLTVNGTPANNAISYQVGSVLTNGLVSIDNFEPIEFSNKTNLAINSGAGVDTVSLNNPNTPTGLAGISVAGGDPTSFDTLIVNGTGTVSVATDSSKITGAGPVSINYATFESLIVNAANNNLTITGSNTYTYTPGAAADAGTVETVTLPIAFTGVGAGKTLTLTGSGGGATVTANGTNGNDSFTLAATTGAITLGGALAGRATIAPTSIASLIVNGLDGDDAFSVTGPQPYTNITLAGGDPSASDVASLTGDGTAVVAHLGGATASVTGGALGNVALPGIEVLNLNAGAGSITLAGTSSGDAFTVTPTGANTATSQVGTLSPVVNSTTTSTLTVDADGGSDTLTITATSAGDTINVSGAAVTVVGLQPVNFVNVESLAVNGLAGIDTFNVTSSATLPISIDGGDPVGVLPGDLLNIVTVPGDIVNLFPGPTSDSGGVVVNSNQPITYVHIESLSVMGGGSPIINGTNGNDVITIIARDSSYAPGLDGVQDFTVSVNAGPNLLFINSPAVIVHALAGDDQIVVQAPAPNLAAWNVAVTADGGPSSALGDQLVVSTPGANQATYTPASANSGALGVTNSSGNVTNVTITDIENFVYDGQAGGDSLKMVGSSAANAFTVTPGATNDAGTLSMDSTLPVSFQNLGASGQVVVDGNGGADTLTYNGTPGNDTFVVDNSVLGGKINLNARVPLLTANLSNVSLIGQGGDDTFTLVPTILSSPYLMLRLIGGPPASATGSQANLTATAGTPIFLSGQVITQGAFTVAGSGLQNENLNGAGNDTTYNSVVGVTENINVIASPTANQGQVSVPGVALWSFSNVPIVYVNGTAADNDIVTLTGTNNNDVFQVNLAAAGTDLNPVLKLQTPAGTTLLTLGNYTGFKTLNIVGLDGTDIFNVTVAPTGPGRQIFINGELPGGKKKLTDVLNFIYVKPRPRIVQSVSTQDHDAGLVSADYGPGLPSFLVQYDGIENVTIRQQ